jgi:PAS domain-containing protein
VAVTTDHCADAASARIAELEARVAELERERDELRALHESARHEPLPVRPGAAEPTRGEGEATLANAGCRIGAGVRDIDLVTGRSIWSDSYYELYGLPRSVQPSQASRLASIHPDDRARVMAEYRGALKTHGLQHIEFGKRVREMLPQLADTMEPELREALETGRPLYNKEAVGETPSRPGVERSWLHHSLPVRNAAGQVTGISIVVEETTKRRQAELALREAARRKDEFLATLAHELRNPLAPPAQRPRTARAGRPAASVGGGYHRQDATPARAVGAPGG